MPGMVSREIAGETQLVRLPRSSTRRGLITYCRLLKSVEPDTIWGGWSFDGPVFRPGILINEQDLPRAALLLECAGAHPGGRGHNRAPVLYILWRYEGAEWLELARVSSVGRDWTVDLGPIAQRELRPPKPFLVDPAISALRIVDAIERELEPLEFKARVLVIRAVEDRLAMRMAG